MSETCEHSPVSGCVAQCGLGTNWIAASTHGAHCRYSSSWLPNYKIIIRLRHKAHSIQHTIWPAQHFLGMSSFRLLVNCLANTTRKYFMSTSELYNMRQPSCPSAAYTLTAGAVWRLQWVHTPIHQHPSRCGHETRYLDTYLGWLWVPPSLAWSLVVGGNTGNGCGGGSWSGEVVTLSSALSHPSLDAGCSPFKNSTKPIKRRRLNKLDLTNKDCG